MWKEAPRSSTARLSDPNRPVQGSKSLGVPRGRLLARMFVPGKSGPRFGQVVWPLAFAIHNRTEVRLCQTRNHPLTTGGT